MKIKFPVPVDSLDNSCLVLLMEHHDIKYELNGNFYIVKSLLNDQVVIDDLYEYLRLNKIQWIEK